MWLPPLVLVAVAVIGLADYLSGPLVSFSLFYLLPVVACAWRAGERAGALAAAAASVAWLVAELASRDAPLPVTIWNGFTRLAIFVMTALLVARTHRDRDRMAKLNERLNQLLAHEEGLARTDPLTGLPNSRAFAERLDAELERCHRETTPFCVGYLDLDNFKRVNDIFGHAAGDEALREVAEALRQGLRRVDAVGRLAGDEFGVLFTGTKPAGIVELGERILRLLDQVGARYPDTGLAASLGVAYYAVAPPDQDEAVRAADDAMYQAKREGKHRVVITMAEAVSATGAGGAARRRHDNGS